MMKRFHAVIKNNSEGINRGLLSGVMIGTSFVPFPPWAIFFCFVPLWITVYRTPSIKKVFLYSWITQFSLSLIGFHWIAFTAAEFGNFSWPVSLLIMLAFCSVGNLYIPITLSLVKKLSNRFHFSLGYFSFFSAVGISLGERVWPSIFNWNFGYTFLWGKWPLYHFADLIGFEGLSTFVLLTNSYLVYTWKTPKHKLALVKVGLLILVLTGTGYFYGKSWAPGEFDILIQPVQANIGNLDKVYAEKGKLKYQDSILDDFFRLTSSKINSNSLKPDLIVWPETSYPGYLDTPYLSQSRNQRLLSQIKIWNTYLFTGAFGKSEKQNTPTITFNSFFGFTNLGIPIEPPYRKTHLLAFGEYFPGATLFPVLTDLFPFISNFGRGSGPMTWTIPLASHQFQKSVIIGPQICYEGLSSDFSQDLALKGSQVLLNITNDSWFGTPFEPLQHLYITFGRAIETRLPLVRVTNTGISAGISRTGDILFKSPQDLEWSEIVKIPVPDRPQITFYSRYAIHLNLFLIFFTLLVFTYFVQSNLKQKRN